MPWHRFGDGFACGARAALGPGFRGPLMGLFLLLLFLVLVGLFVWLIVALVRRSGHAKAPAITPVASTLPGGQDALEVLRLRYARGEITREEYLATRDDLSK